MKFVYRIDVDYLEKKKFKFNFLNSYSSDNGELILLDNDYFVIVRYELTWLLLLKKCLIDCELKKFEI